MSCARHVHNNVQAPRVGSVEEPAQSIMIGAAWAKCREQEAIKELHAPLPPSQEAECQGSRNPRVRERLAVCRAQ